ncbi:MAG: NAD-dependent epimerase/dehydratase family protein [Candidatus Kapabacteria bacterium]|nr:NAD-dependent epimerase/dehydratase family protein [Candidatus Kapabacteria bacterium]
MRKDQLRHQGPSLRYCQEGTVKILVTGGAGFIASHVAEAYLGAGHEVVIVDDLSMGYRKNIPDGARFVEMSITDDAFADFVISEKFDVVNHHAAHMELRVSVDKPVHDATINVLGSLRLLEAARRSGVSHVILASTTAVLGEFIHMPAAEDHPVRPIAPYGVSKRSMELYADYERITHGMSITTLRYTNVYGPRQNPHGESGVIAIFLEKFMQGAIPTIHGDGTQERDYIHVHDVAAANIAALEHRVQGTYHICCNSAASVNDVVRALRSALGQNFEVHHGPAKPGDPARTRGSYEAFSGITGWRPLIELEQGIHQTVRWFQADHSEQ